MCVKVLQTALRSLERRELIAMAICHLTRAVDMRAFVVLCDDALSFTGTKHKSNLKRSSSDIFNWGFWVVFFLIEQTRSALLLILVSVDVSIKTET